jgi:hypothetical protein
MNFYRLQTIVKLLNKLKTILKGGCGGDRGRDGGSQHGEIN